MLTAPDTTNLTDEIEDRSWWAEASCATGGAGLSALFFSDELTRREPWGVWGGQLFLNGHILTAKRRRGRPPKVARPEDHFPEVPIPEHLRSA